jgi:hypothetical protein
MIIFNLKIFNMDSIWPTSEFLEANLELIEDVYWIKRTMEEDGCSLEDTLELYGVSEEDYNKVKDL